MVEKKGGCKRSVAGRKGGCGRDRLRGQDCRRAAGGWLGEPCVLTSE